MICDYIPDEEADGCFVLFQWQKHFVSMFETLCFDDGNTLFQWQKQMEPIIGQKQSHIYLVCEVWGDFQ